MKPKTEVLITMDDTTEMLSIEINHKINFYGNYWDFNRHNIINLLKALPGIELKIEQKDYEEGD